MTITFYNLTHILGLIIALLFVVFIAPKYKLPRIRSLLCAIISYAIGYILMRLLYAVVTKSIGGQNMIRLIGFLPIIIFTCSEIMGMHAEDFLDMAAPAICLIQGIAKIGCQVEGCCSSWLEVSWGIYNLHYAKNLFPIQTVESIVAILIAFTLFLISRKKKYNTNGRMMPLMLVLFGGTRFFLEFLRRGNTIFLGLKEFQLWSLFILLEGIIWLILTRKKQDTILINSNEGK